MPLISRNVDLTCRHTFQTPARAKYYAEVTTPEELFILSTEKIFKQNKRLILGGGSNVLFVNDFEGLVIHNAIKGIEKVSENDTEVVLRVKGGENWHAFVCHTVEKNYWGIENLALIPGTVGAAPIQNIGAYGVELKDVLVSVTFYHFAERCMVSYTASDCRLGYRDSIFKNHLKQQVFIESIEVKLSKIPHPVLHYGDIQKRIEEKKSGILSPRVVAQTIMEIRQEKLPDPDKIGNAGSFFKNPVISHDHFRELVSLYKDIPYYPQSNGIKIPAAWLIEQCGWKGKTIEGKYGVYPKQSLVLVNYGRATGREIYALSEEIIRSVQRKFSIILEREVNIIM